MVLLCLCGFAVFSGVVFCFFFAFLVRVLQHVVLPADAGVRLFVESLPRAFHNTQVTFAGYSRKEPTVRVGSGLSSSLRFFFLTVFLSRVRVRDIWLSGDASLLHGLRLSQDCFSLYVRVLSTTTLGQKHTGCCRFCGDTGSESYN